METVVSAMYDARRRTVEYAVDLRQSAEMHRVIYRAIRARDPVGARKAMEQHLCLAESAQAKPSADIVFTLWDDWLGWWPEMFHTI